MRYLLDSNIFVFIATDPERLSNDVKCLLQDWDASWCMSVESVKELIVAFRNKGITDKIWKTEDDLLNAIENEFYIKVLPVTMDVMRMYAHLCLNVRDGHKDPSDHIIISQAMTLKMPLVSSDHKFLFYRNQGLDLIYNE